MAEGFFNALIRDKSILAESAGVGATDGAPASASAIEEMKRREIDISHHRARHVNSIDITKFEMAIALDREVAVFFRTALPDYQALVTWDIPDPFGGSPVGYQPTADMIRAHIEEFIRELG